MLTTERRGSAKSLASDVSSIRTFCLQADIPFLSKRDDARLKKLRQQLEYDDPYPVRRVEPFGIELIKEYILKHLQVGTNHYHLMLATVLLVLYQACLRGGDIFSVWNYLRVSNLEWDHANRRVTITLGPIKNNQRVTGGTATIEDYPGISAYKFLLRWFNRQRLWNKPNHYLFPMPSRSSSSKATLFDFRKPATKMWLDRQIKRTAKELGLDPTKYTAHSFRPALATDLFRQGVPIETVMAAGRWRSLAALIYYRDKAMGPTLVARAIANTLRQRKGRS